MPGMDSLVYKHQVKVDKQMSTNYHHGALKGLYHQFGNAWNLVQDASHNLMPIILPIGKVNRRFKKFFKIFASCRLKSASSGAFSIEGLYI
jgi:hypothetical protein